MAGDTEAVSIEQMNKVRVSLGLAPLPVPGKTSGPQFKGEDDEASDSDESDDMSTIDKRQAAAGSNWQKLETERQEKLDRQKRKDAAKKSRDAAARFEKLRGKGLGDADEAELDTRTWLVQQKKRQKKIDKARKLEEELAAREQQVEYTSMDLAGVKVGHQSGEFDEFSGEQILTLKDAQIGEESEDDELENADLKAKEKLEERLRLRKKRPDYDPTEQEEKQGILSKYDEEIDGKRQKRFTLDGQGNSVEASRKRLDAEGSIKGKGVKIDLDLLKEDVPISDYVDASSTKIKKPKKGKKEKKTRQKTADEDDIVPGSVQPAQPDAMEVDGGEITNGAGKKRAFEFDDDDLQAKLAEQRRQALKKRKKTDAAELARQMREELAVDEEEEEGLTVDETSEFVANLQPEDDDDKAKKAEAKQSITSFARNQNDDGDGDVNMESYAGIEDEEDLERRLARDTPAPGDKTLTGLEDEESLTGGIAATMNMLRRRGVVDKYTPGDDRTEAERRRARFLADKQDLVDEFDAKAREQREADRRSGRYDKMSNRERDGLAQKQNDAREQYISKLLAEKFTKEYRPDVKLRYNDEYGREMNQKEAFKQLSHMFHGKGSGKQKTEKRMKKIEEEKRDMAKGMLNVGSEGGMIDVQGREGKRQKTAGVRLN